MTGGGSNGRPRTSAGAADQSYSPPRFVSGRRKKYGCVRSAPCATVTTKRRASAVFGVTDGAPNSSRSMPHPAGAAIATLSSLTVLSPACQTVTSSWTRSPGVRMPSSAVPSSVTPAAAAIARSSRSRCAESAVPRGRAARGRERAIEQVALHRIRRAEESRRAQQIWKGGRRMPGIERRARGVNERGVPRNVNRRVDAGKHRRLAGLRHLRREERDTGRRGAHALQLPHVLRAVPAATRHRNLEKRLTDQRIERADRERQRGRRRIAARRSVELLWSAGRIAQEIERLSRENGRDLVVTVSVGGRPGKDGDHDLRPEAAHHRDHVLEDRVARPEAERLIGGLGVAEVVGGGEEQSGR